MLFQSLDIEKRAVLAHLQHLQVYYVHAPRLSLRWDIKFSNQKSGNCLQDETNCIVVWKVSSHDMERGDIWAANEGRGGRWGQHPAEPHMQAYVPRQAVRSRPRSHTPPIQYQYGDKITNHSLTQYNCLNSFFFFIFDSIQEITVMEAFTFRCRSMHSTRLTAVATKLTRRLHPETWDVGTNNDFANRI